MDKSCVFLLIFNSTNLVPRVMTTTAMMIGNKKVLFHPWHIIWKNLTFQVVIVICNGNAVGPVWSVKPVERRRRLVKHRWILIAIASNYPSFDKHRTIEPLLLPRRTIVWNNHTHRTVPPVAAATATKKKKKYPKLVLFPVSYIQQQQITSPCRRRLLLLPTTTIGWMMIPIKVTDLNNFVSHASRPIRLLPLPCRVYQCHHQYHYH